MLLTDTFIDLFYFTEVNSVYDFDQFTFDTLRKKYDEMITTSEKMALQNSITIDSWRKAFFAVAVWIDEVVQLSSWEHRQSWSRDPLQRTYFKTSNGGVEFFTSLERLDPSENRIREIYDLCLSLGFKGTYYRETDNDTRQQIINRTIQFLKTDRNTDIPGILFPCAYKGTSKLNIHVEKQNILAYLIVLIALPPVIFLFLYISFSVNVSSLFHNWLTLTGGIAQ